MRSGGLPPSKGVICAPAEPSAAGALPASKPELALAFAAVADLPPGRRNRYNGTAIKMHTATSATTICARSGRSRPPAPTPKRREDGSPEPDGNVEREGGPAMRAEPPTLLDASLSHRATP